MRYTEEEAALYQNIELKGSTFEVSLVPAIVSLGSLTGKTVLDFGAGTGRSARALRECGATRVIAVDVNMNMLKAAPHYPGVERLQVGRFLPLREQSVDAVLSVNVFTEFSKLEDMLAACREIWRVLKEGQSFSMVMTNPDSIFADFVSTRYINVASLKSGTPITCLIKGSEPTFIQDYYWTVDDYSSTLTAAGFEIKELLLPTARADEGEWLDETRIAPDLVIRAIRMAE